MNVFAVIAIAMVLVIVALRKKVPIGPAILAGGLFIWALTKPEPGLLLDAAKQTLTMPRTYDLLFALYFVVCLEIELRKSGCLKGMVSYLNHLIHSTKVTLAVMPAFLGLLPSVGGARFSAPIVENASKGMTISPEQKSIVNLWFRHIFEYSSPIVPGMILACSIVGIGVGELIVHLAWVTILMFVLGWILFVRPMEFTDLRAVNKEQKEAIDLAHCRTDFWLSILPVVAVFCLMVFGGVGAAVSMGAIAVLMVPLLMFMNRGVPVMDIFAGALEWKLIRDVTCILLFIQVLDVTGVLSQIVTSFRTAPLPTPVIIAGLSFLIGFLTGMSQGHVAIVMPIVAMLAPAGSLDLAGVALVFGVGGQMVTPTHVCLIVTLDYFKSDFFKTLNPIIVAEVILLAIFSLYTYLTWAA
jgi:putative membrane protein